MAGRGGHEGVGGSPGFFGPIEFSSGGFLPMCMTAVSQ
jgi:hypothetical protein